MPLSDLLDDDAPGVLREYWDIVRPRLDRFAFAQHGVRTGTTVTDHILHGACFLGSLLPQPLLGFTPDEVRLLLAAFTVHDANKMIGDGTPLYRVLQEDRFLTLCNDLALPQFLPDFDRCLPDLRLLSANTAQRSGRPGDGLFRPAPERDQLMHRLRPAMTAADLHDLSHSFHEVAQKEKVIARLREATSRPLFLAHHRVAEYLGPFTALLHSAIASLAAQQGALPAWVYPEGTWYLSPVPDLSFGSDAICSAYLATRDAAMGDGIGAFFDRQVKDGFKLDPQALSRWDDDRLVDEIEDYIRQRSAESIWKNLAEKRLPALAPEDPRHPARLPAGLRWPQHPDEVTPGRLWLAAENLLKHKAVKLPGAPAERLVEEVIRQGAADERLRQLLSLQGLDPLYERPYLLVVSTPDPWRAARAALRAALTLTRELTGLAVGRQVATAELRRYVELNVSFGAAAAPASFSVYLQRYLQDDRSSLGPALGPVSDLMSSEMLGDTRVSQFSNSLPGGKGDPKRQRDALMGEVMAVQARTSPYPKAAPPLFLHLFPGRTSTRLHWDSLAGAPDRERLRRGGEEPDRALALDLRILDGNLRVDWRDLFYGQIPPGKRVLHGNGMTIPIAPPPDASDSLAYLDAALQAAEVIHETRLRGVLSPFLAVSPPADDRAGPAGPAADRWPLRLEGPPFLLTGLLGLAADFGALRARLRDVAYLNLRLRPRPDKDVRMDLVRAAGRPLPVVLHAIDRLIEKCADSDWAAIRLAGEALPRCRLLQAESKMNDRPEISELLEKMAAIAVEERRLLGDGFSRHDLLLALNHALKMLRRARGLSDARLLLAAAEDRIYTAKETVQKREGFQVGARHRAAAREFIALLTLLLEKGYENDPARLRADERLLRSAYITFVRAELDRRRPAEARPQDEARPTADA